MHCKTNYDLWDFKVLLPDILIIFVTVLISVYLSNNCFVLVAHFVVICSQVSLVKEIWSQWDFLNEKKKQQLTNCAWRRQTRALHMEIYVLKAPCGGIIWSWWYSAIFLTFHWQQTRWLTHVYCITSGLSHQRGYSCRFCSLYQVWYWNYTSLICFSFLPTNQFLSCTTCEFSFLSLLPLM